MGMQTDHNPCPSECSFPALRQRSALLQATSALALSCMLLRQDCNTKALQACSDLATLVDTLSMVCATHITSTADAASRNRSKKVAQSCEELSSTFLAVQCLLKASAALHGSASMDPAQPTNLERILKHVDVIKKALLDHVPAAPPDKRLTCTNATVDALHGPTGVDEGVPGKASKRRKTRTDTAWYLVRAEVTLLAVTSDSAHDLALAANLVLDRWENAQQQAEAQTGEGLSVLAVAPAKPVTPEALQHLTQDVRVACGSAWRALEQLVARFVHACCLLAGSEDGVDRAAFVAMTAHFLRSTLLAMEAACRGAPLVALCRCLLASPRLSSPSFLLSSSATQSPLATGLLAL
jgi:hypothetical protein